MTIRYKCDECGAALNIKDELAGTQGHCPRCHGEFTVPAPEGSAVGEIVAGAGAAAPSQKKQRVPGEPISEDDIGDFLIADGPGAAPSDYHVSVAADEVDQDPDRGPDEDPIDDAGAGPRSRRRKSRKKDDDEFDDELENESGDQDDEDDDAEDEDDSDSRRKKKRRRAAKSAGVKSDSSESAAIAKNLMARGDRAAQREEKKGGRPFGGAEGARDEGDGFAASEVAGYFVKQAWPYLIGGVAFMGLCYWISSSLFKGLDLPPLATVTGTVTLDGKPLEKAIVQFQPALESGPKANLRLATSFGFTDQDGKYKLTYVVVDEKEIMGAVIGKHLVVIKASNPDGSERLPGHYTNTSKSVLKADVTKGMPPLDFKLSSAPEPPPQ